MHKEILCKHLDLGPYIQRRVKLSPKLKFTKNGFANPEIKLKLIFGLCSTESIKFNPNYISVIMEINPEVIPKLA